MARVGGNLLIVDRFTGKRVSENDTFTCCHCNRPNVVEYKRDKGCAATDFDFCRQCMKPVGACCAGKGCTPFERKLEQHEARGRLLASMGL
jgi:hypothetical protein